MHDVIVVGGGNAALCAALSASEFSKRVLVLERAPQDEAGGNSRFTAGLFRLAYTGPEDLKTLIPDLSADEIANTDFGTYTEEQFLDDMARLTEYRCDPDLTEILVKQSFPTAKWMRQKGVRFTAAWGRQAFKIGGKFKFWGGLTVEAVGGGPGLVESLTQIAKKAGIEIWYGARATTCSACKIPSLMRRRMRWLLTPSAAAVSDMVSHSPSLCAERYARMSLTMRTELTRTAVHVLP